MGPDLESKTGNLREENCVKKIASAISYRGAAENAA